MKKSDLAQIFQDLGKLDKVEDIRAKLVNLQEDLESDYENHEVIANENTSLKESIKDLKAMNHDLYLKTTKREEENKDEEDETKNLKYEDLFDEKGGLK